MAVNWRKHRLRVVRKRRRWCVVSKMVNGVTYSCHRTKAAAEKKRKRVMALRKRDDL